MIHDLTTVLRHPKSNQVDSQSAAEIVDLMNAEDAQIAAAVGKEKDAIARAMELIAEGFRRGGRLLYIGAGTSGRLGVLDASECPPTFSTPPGMVVGIIAGGEKALTKAVEGAEDAPQQAKADLQQHGFCRDDVLVGITTSGRTPYVIGAVQYARSLGAVTIGFTCNQDSELHAHADSVIAPVVGPEIISGSTRLKSGTATKMVLNMLTTGAMVLIGKTYGNLMVDLKASNSKLRARSIRIVADITGLCDVEAEQLLRQCDGEVKTAVVCAVRKVDAKSARQLLTEAKGRLRTVLQVNTDEASPKREIGE